MLCQPFPDLLLPMFIVDAHLQVLLSSIPQVQSSALTHKRLDRAVRPVRSGGRSRTRLQLASFKALIHARRMRWAPRAVDFGRAGRGGSGGCRPAGAERAVARAAAWPQGRLARGSRRPCRPVRDARSAGQGRGSAAELLPLGSRHEEVGLVLAYRGGFVLRRDDGGVWRLDGPGALAVHVSGLVRIAGPCSGFDQLKVEAVNLQANPGVSSSVSSTDSTKSCNGPKRPSACSRTAHAYASRRMRNGPARRREAGTASGAIDATGR